MVDSPLPPVFQCTPLCRHLTEDETAALADCLLRQTFGARSVVCSEGDLAELVVIDCRTGFDDATLAALDQTSDPCWGRFRNHDGRFRNVEAPCEQGGGSPM